MPFAVVPTFVPYVFIHISVMALSCISCILFVFFFSFEILNIRLVALCIHIHHNMYGCSPEEYHHSIALYTTTILRLWFDMDGLLVWCYTIGFITQRGAVSISNTDTYIPLCNISYHFTVPSTCYSIPHDGR